MEEFKAKVQELNRIAIPVITAEILKIRKGSIVKVQIEKVR